MPRLAAPPLAVPVTICLLCACPLAWAYAGGSRSVTTVTEAPAAPTILQTGEHLVADNGLICVEFIAVDGIHRLWKVRGIPHGQDYLTDDFITSSEALWQLMLRPDYGRAEGERIVNIGDATASNVDAQSDEQECVLRLTWSGMDLPGADDALDVEVSVTLRAGDPLSRWRIAVRNRSPRWGLWQVRFPILELRPIGDDRADNALVLGKDRGRLVERCFDAPLGFGHGFHAEEPPPVGFGQSMPGSLSMQFQTLYNQRSRTGVYIGTYDSESYAKHIRIVNSPQSLLYELGHDPIDMGKPATDYAMDYDFVLRPLDGDWFDACQIYREWALRQPWCRKGPLHERDDIPTWFKESPLFLTGHAGSDEVRLKEQADVWLEYLRVAGMPCGGTWYGWKQYITELTAYDLPNSAWRVPEMRDLPCSNVHDGNYPKLPALPSFGEACQRIRAADGHPAPYVCLQIFDQGRLQPSPYLHEAEPAASRDVRGVIETYPGEPSWLMCTWPRWWRDRLAETCSLLVSDQHAGGVYLDTMHGGGHACYSPTHGHSHGGGNDRARGMHELARICRDAVKAADPDAYTDGENPTEDMIDVVDGILYQRTVYPHLSAPIFAAVYGDYICRYGINCNPDEGEVFYIAAASLFVEGAKIGRISATPGSSPHRAELAEQMAFLRQLCGYYRQPAAREFLCYGHLVRPPRFVQPDPMPLTDCIESRGQTYLDGRVRLPVLQTGAFVSPGREVGIFIVNVADGSLAFAADVPLPEYGLPEGRTHSVRQIGCDGHTSTIGEWTGGTLTLAGTLPPRSATMYRIASR